MVEIVLRNGDRVVSQKFPKCNGNSIRYWYDKHQIKSKLRAEEAISERESEE